MSVNKSTKKQRWYLGGLASAGAAACTHPLDLLKVHLQTQQVVEKRLLSMAVNVVRTQGNLALYNGLSASLARQLSYSTTRFGIYEVLRAKIQADKGYVPFYQKIVIGAIGGACGGLVGSPADMVNVRMQNDVKVALEVRRNYKHIGDGLIRVIREEGVMNLWRGSSLNITRAVLVTVSQVALYEQVKQFLISTSIFSDNIITHFSSSIIAGIIATAMTQPVDVVKTRMMNAKPGDYKSIVHCTLYTARLGPLGFFKGFVPSFTRLGPQTILTWIFLEQLRRLFPLNS
ncbi:PREDICTED: mitochondrial dicarboxylate carrier-like [Amphimedon queenslandica]|uniref:Mitochondrial dicarboxylate carrier n=1 Tax=Amphimedon queenslandica TaxID=400682 RepID=A0A1X7VTG4_AMPQE|nr:PREDICTED: mitochondrial dicarboxylate carrier-like [Amphimedon queenslandica]|eukprot:XP_003382862.1 PREDICTED: mitochondrial dicarboxylate carrier-like [Amphimedon queenslandica]